MTTPPVADPNDPARRICQYTRCGVSFAPDPSNRGPGQAFCSTPHRRAQWQLDRQQQPHKCPYCGVIHDPEERPILDALALELHDLEWQPGSNGRTLLDGIKAFIERRRAILQPDRARVASQSTDATYQGPGPV